MKLMISNLFNKLFLCLNIYIKSTSWWDHIIDFTQEYIPIINNKRAVCFLPQTGSQKLSCTSRAKQILGVQT